MAILAKPHEAVYLFSLAYGFYYQSYGVCLPLWGVGSPARQEKHLPLFNRNVHNLAFIVLLYSHHNISLQLVEKLLTLIVVKVLTAVWPPHNHYNEVTGILINFCITNRGFQQR